MEGKIDVNRLSKDELIYEMVIRGGEVKDATVENMRKDLRSFLRLEQSKVALEYPSYPFKFQEDCDYLIAKCVEVENLVRDFSDFETSSTFKKISSKLVHCFKRTERSVATNAEEKKKRSQLLVQFVRFQADLSSRAKRYKRSSMKEDLPVEISVLNLSGEDPAGETSDSSDEDVPAFPHAASSPKTDPIPAPQSNCVPVSKWNLTRFDGENGNLSLSAFLENVEELRISRNVSANLLFRSASDLFTGKALIWFRSVRSRISSWPELVVELKRQFLPPNFNEKLLEEIKARTQGANESMGIYIATITNMFGRLSVSVPEATRIKILLRNIHPFYQSQLGLVDFDSVDQLLEFGRKLEARKESIESFKPPPRNRSGLMEPDLAYVSSDSPSLMIANVSEVSIKCWRCHRTGHRARQCDSPSSSQRYCFRCGTPNFTVRSCPKCNPVSASGNDSRRS